MNKATFLKFVNAVIVLATTKATNHAELEKAQTQAREAVAELQQVKAADAASAEEQKLTAEETSQVQQALNLISAAEPPAPAAVEQVASNVLQTDQAQAPQA